MTNYRINLNGLDFVTKQPTADDYKEYYTSVLFGAFKEESDGQSQQNSLVAIGKRNVVKVEAEGQEFTAFEKIADDYFARCATASLEIECDLIETDDPFAVFTADTVTYKLKNPHTKDEWFITVKTKNNALQKRFEGQSINTEKVNSNKWLRGQIENLIGKRVDLFNEIKTDAQGYENNEIPLQHMIRVLGVHFFVERRKN